MLTAYITNGAEGVRQALGSLASSLIAALIPGPLGGALGGLVNALFNRPKKPQHVIVDNAVRVFPANLSLPYAMNPASQVFGSRGMATGAGFTVNVNYAPGADKVVTAMVGGGLRWTNAFQGVS